MTNEQMTQRIDSTEKGKMYLSFELSNKKWLLMFSDGMKRRQKAIEAGNTVEFEIEIEKAKERFKMDDDVEIHSCYEAGRDGFWIHRYLSSKGIHSLVVDPSSIEVNRRQRRCKTDRVDVEKLMNMLIRYINGEQKVWSVVRVPNEEAEDLMRMEREEKRLKKERGAHTNRIGSLLWLHKIRLKIGRDFLKDLEEVKRWDGSPLPERIKNEIKREYKRYEMIKEQLKVLEQEKEGVLLSGISQAQKSAKLAKLKGLGPVFTWILIFEFFGWRDFKNVKQVGAASGLAPTLYASGDASVEQGISKAGNRLIRSTMIELAWLWLRFQPESELSRWFQERFGGGGKRMRRVGIVALARKLLVAIWKYLEKDILPEGAVFKVGQAM